jgi:hypothetical protein
MPGLLPGIHVFFCMDERQTRRAVPSPGTTNKGSHNEERAEQVYTCSALKHLRACADQELRLPGSTFTPGPIVDETAMR